MRALALTIALASSGCFTSWAITQGFGTQRILDEGVREQTVPLAGVDEKLAVSLPLDIQYEYAPPAQGTTSTTMQTRERTELPFALTCSTKQYARDRTYHSAFRYGSRWKKMSGISFLAEAALGAVFLLLDRNRDQSDPMKANDRSGLVAGGFFALDAIGTAAIFFIPRKEVFTVDEKAVMTPIREDCPDGLVLEIAGASYPIDAAGRIGEVGEVALDEWMRSGSSPGTTSPGTSSPGTSSPGTSSPGTTSPGTTSPGTLTLTFEGRAMPLRVDARERCAWVRARSNTTAADSASATGANVARVRVADSQNLGPSPVSLPDDPVQRACNTPGQYVTMADLPRVTTAVITVPTGSLSMVTAPASADAH